MSAKNKEIVRRFLDEAWLQDNVPLAAERIADKLNYNGLMTISREQWKQIAIGSGSYLGDRTVVIEDIIAVGDRVVTRVTTSGKHIGDWPVQGFGVMAKTGKPYTMRIITIWRIVGGQIADIWEESNMLDVMNQLGALKPPA